MNRTAPPSDNSWRTRFSWIGFAGLAAGISAYAGVSGISSYRMRTIAENPCIKNALGASRIEHWLIGTALVCLLIAVGTFGAGLISSFRGQVRDSTTRHAWVGLAVGIVFLLPVTNLVAGDPLGFDAQMLPNCATMAPQRDAS